jgi:alpha-L-arabinofuranosidase
MAFRLAAAGLSVFFAMSVASAQEATIRVDAAKVLHRLSPYLTGACIEDVNHEVYGGIDSQMIFGESFQEPCPGDDNVSGMWRPLQTGTALGRYAFEKNGPFVGGQSQRITFVRGKGEIGIENKGLKRWGMFFQEGKSYEGRLWCKTEKPTTVFVSLESCDGSRNYAEAQLTVVPGDWQRLPFELTPSQTDKSGRFAVKLKQPGSVVLGYAFLQPGEWGRFKGLPVRKDVGDGLVAQGLTVLRQGGCMVNAPEYRWKKMIGPRDRRPPYVGFWYPHSSNGWGIFDFLNFCEAAGILGVPDVNMGETPQDMADFVEYVNGPADSPWGKKRAADGHPRPYGLKYVELGNEEHVNDDYWRLFKPMAEAMWAKDAKIVLVVGDFCYDQPITDPYKFEGGAVNTLATQKKILELAKRHDREVWFDVHTGSDTPREWQGLGGVPSYIKALKQICPGAKFRVVIFEFNANCHNVGRALGNAREINEFQRLGSVPICCSANCLQPYRQNDNGWNQGLLFPSPSQVWSQPPGYVAQMHSRWRLPQCVQSDVTSPQNSLDVTAVRSKDGKTVQLQVVNLEGKSMPTELRLQGFTPAKRMAKVVTLSGALNDVNTPEEPEKIAPQEGPWRHELKDGKATYTFPPYSFTILRFQ